MRAHHINEAKNDSITDDSFGYDKKNALKSTIFEIECFIFRVLFIYLFFEELMQHFLGSLSLSTSSDTRVWVIRIEAEERRKRLQSLHGLGVATQFLLFFEF